MSQRRGALSVLRLRRTLTYLARNSHGPIKRTGICRSIDYLIAKWFAQEEKSVIVTISMWSRLGGRTLFSLQTWLLLLERPVVHLPLPLLNAILQPFGSENRTIEAVHKPERHTSAIRSLIIQRQDLHNRLNSSHVSYQTTSFSIIRETSSGITSLNASWYLSQISDFLCRDYTSSMLYLTTQPLSSKKGFRKSSASRQRMLIRHLQQARSKT